LSISDTRKQELIKEFGISESDTGSTHVQVAVLTERIRNITEHLKKNKKDYASQRGLMQMVGRRSTLLKYLARRNHQQYRTLIAALGLRK